MKETIKALMLTFIISGATISLGIMIANKLCQPLNPYNINCDMEISSEGNVEVIC